MIYFDFWYRSSHHILYSVENMTWILMEIPCRFPSQIDGSLAQIDTKFHGYSMSFVLILFVFHAGTWHGFWTSSSHGISLALAKKMIYIRFGLTFNQTAVKKTWENPHNVTFFTGSFCFSFPPSNSITLWTELLWFLKNPLYFLL